MIIRLFSVVFSTVSTMHKLDFRVVINEACNKWQPVLVEKLCPFLIETYVVTWYISFPVSVKGVYPHCKSAAYSWVKDFNVSFVKSSSIWQVQNIWSGTTVAQWLRCCATNWKVAGLIPDDVIGIFHWHNPSDRTVALGSTQPLTEMSTRSISWG